MSRKRKRGALEGNIRERSDGRWEGRVLLGYSDGKPVRPSFYGKTRREVQHEIAKAVKGFNEGTFVPTHQQTVSEFLDRWLDDVAKPSVRPKTYDSYKQLVENHLKPKLGQIRLQKLSPEQVQAFLNERSSAGLSARTVQYVRAVLRRALGQALKWGAVSRNVATLVTPPRLQKKEVRPLTPAQAKTFLRVIKGHRFEALWASALWLGLRQGELLGLRWTDVDLKKKELRVSFALQCLDGKFELVEPKSASSRRTLSLPPAVVKATRPDKGRSGYGPGRPGRIGTWCSPRAAVGHSTGLA